jgi:hypothetical protein
VTSYTLIDRYQRFGGQYSLHNGANLCTKLHGLTSRKTVILVICIVYRYLISFYKLIFLSNSQEVDDALPKLWYRQDVLLEGPPVEVELDMGATPRVHVTPDHALVLHNVTSADTGVYHCLKFSYLLDGKPHLACYFLSA